MNNSVDNETVSAGTLRSERLFACLTVTVCLHSLFMAPAYCQTKNSPNVINAIAVSSAANQTHKKSKHEVDLKSTQCDDVLGTNAGIAPLPGNPNRPTVALALGGGGVRGAAHIGVLRAFEEAHIPIDFIAGTSMGAIVGGLYAAGVSLDNIEDMFRDRHALKKACVPFPMSLQLSVRLPKRIVGLGSKPVAGLFSGDRLGEFIDASVPEECRRIENTKIKFAAVAADLLDGNTYAITGGDLGSGVQASCSIPLLYRPVCTSDGKILVDGGVKGNLPTWVAKCSKADIVITVNVNESVNPISKERIKGIFGLLNRASNMVLSQSDARQLGFGDLYICPEMPDISLYSHKLSDARQAIDAGTIAASKNIEKIKQLMASKSNKSVGDERQLTH